ncbi:MAG TPA: hypothetical protein VH092_29760 [Urbifossiella sp.]|nr:hypothetical protein [Urbifossiella sp.]
MAEGSELRVVGSGAVTVLDLAAAVGGNALDLAADRHLGIFDVRMHVLPEGYRFRLADRTPLPPASHPPRDHKDEGKGRPEPGLRAGPGACKMATSALPPGSDMPILIECAGCPARLAVPPGAGGKRIRCPQCKTVTTLPDDLAAFKVDEDAPRDRADRPERPVRRGVFMNWRWAVIGGRGYGLMAFRDDPRSDDAVTFFDSFELIADTPPAPPPPPPEGPYAVDWRKALATKTGPSVTQQRAAVLRTAEESAKWLTAEKAHVNGADDFCSVRLGPEHMSADGRFRPDVLERLRTAGVTGLTLDGQAALSDAGALELDQLRCLHELSAYSARISDAGMAGFRSLGSLDSLDLYGTPGRPMPLTGEGFRHLTGAAGLKKLYLRDAEFGDAGVAHLARFPALRRLSLDGVNVTDAGVAHLGPMAGLRDLRLSRTRVTGAGFRGQAFAGLETLSLWDSPVTDAGATGLTGLRVQSLALDLTPIGDAGAAEVAKMGSVTVLGLSYTQVGDAGAKALAGMQGLESLSLRGATRLTDTGLDALAGSSRLRRLTVSNTDRLTDTGITRLRRARPTLEVEIGAVESFLVRPQPGAKGP